MAAVQEQVRPLTTVNDVAHSTGITEKVNRLILGHMLAYLAYLCRHKAHVWRAGRRLGVPVLALLLHDLDKLGSLFDYANAYHFHRPNPPAVRLRHYRRSKHHWQSYVVLQDDGTETALPIPKRYMLEMIADWHGAAQATGGTDGKAWYREFGGTIALHPQTRAWVEEQLDAHSIR